MKSARILSMVALAAQLLLGSDGPADNREAVRVTGGAVVPPSPAKLPRVLRKLEPSDSTVIALPGGAIERPAVARPVPEPAPARQIVPVSTLVPAHWHPGVPALPPMPDITPFQPPVVLGVASALPAFLTGPINTPAKAFVPPVWHASEEVPASLPAAPDVVGGPSNVPTDAATLLAGITPAGLRTGESIGAGKSYPPVLVQESAVYCQRQIGLWTLDQAKDILGEPERQRAAFDDDHTENGQIYAFKDPSGRYRELELDFNQVNGMLRTVFVYPWNLTWLECRRLWGAKVSSTEGKQGRMFYSYLNRRLDVLVDNEGKVISLGLY